jgi:hypothetical protein
MKKKCNVVILATEKGSSLYLYKKSELVNKFREHKEGVNTYKNQHLYITSNDEIKEGDWTLMFDDFGNLFICDKPQQYLGIEKGHHLNKGLRKIIATTDPELHKDGVAKIGLPFVEKYILEYNKGNVIKEVNVEYEISKTTKNYLLVEKIEIKYKPKLRKDGTVIIHKIQEVFTKEDIEKAFNAGLDSINAPFQKENYSFETWFEQNY